MRVFAQRWVLVNQWGLVKWHRAYRMSSRMQLAKWLGPTFFKGGIACAHASIA